MAQGRSLGRAVGGGRYSRRCVTVRPGGVGSGGGRECGGDGGGGFLHWVGSPLAALLLRETGGWVW